MSSYRSYLTTLTKGTPDKDFECIENFESGGLDFKVLCNCHNLELISQFTFESLCLIREALQKVYQEFFKMEVDLDYQSPYFQLKIPFVPTKQTHQARQTNQSQRTYKTN